MSLANCLEIKKEALRLVEKNSDLIKEVGSRIWHFAELSREEYQSAHYLASLLTQLGFKVEKGVVGYPTSFIGEYKKGEDGPVIGLLCEYDALPGLSSEEPGKNGHGCGHNLFAAGAIGTAQVIKEIIEKYSINAKIKVFGTPSEESYGSKPFFVKQGLFDDVDFFMGFHPLEYNGVLYSRHNAIISKKYRFYGKASHAGAEPELGISALDAVEIMNVAVNFLREHVTQDVRIHYIITHGGLAANVVPDFAETHYIIRAQEFDNLNLVSQRIDNIAKGASLSTGCKEEIETIEAFANTVLNRPYVELAYNNMCEIGPPDFTTEDQQSVSQFGNGQGLSTKINELLPYQGAWGASTDEGDVSWMGPWIRICMACYADGTPGHSIEVTKQSNMPSAYKGVLQTVKVCTATIVDLLTKPDELKKMKAYYQNAIKG